MDATTENFPDRPTKDLMWSNIERQISKKNRRIRIFASIAAASGLVAAGAGIGASVATAQQVKPIKMTYVDRSGEPRLTEAGAASQAQLDRVDSQILGLVEPGDSSSPAPINGKVSGFASIVNHPSTGSIDLYWKGPIPEKVAAIVMQSKDVIIRQHDVPYSLVDAQKALARAVDYVDSSGSGTVVAQYLGADSQSIEVVISASSAQLTADALKESLAAAAGMPIGSLQLERPGDHSLERSGAVGTYPAP
jgi:hypothetical protein